MHLEIKLGHAIEMIRHQPKKAMLKSFHLFLSHLVADVL